MFVAAMALPRGDVLDWAKTVVHSSKPTKSLSQWTRDELRVLYRELDKKLLKRRESNDPPASPEEIRLMDNRPASSSDKQRLLQAFRVLLPAFESGQLQPGARVELSP